MAGPLRNTRHEAFVQLLLQGETALAAYQGAGYAKDDGNAIRLRDNPKVRERLIELQSEIAKDTKVTVESICRELDEANAVAKSRGQAAAMVSASALRAKLAGLMVEKVEVGAPGAFETCTSVEAIADELLRYELNPYHAVTDADREALVALYGRHFQEVEEFVASIKARPIVGVRVDRPTIGNGKSRP